MPAVKRSIKKLNVAITVTLILGFAVSYYAYKVKTIKENDDSYEAMCDISEHISCTKAFSSKYGKGLGIIPETSILYLPNSVFGLIFYGLVGILSTFTTYVPSVLVVALAILSNIGTIYLAYILYILNNICVICVTIYIINAVLLILVFEKHRQLFKNGTKKQKKKKKKHSD